MRGQGEGGKLPKGPPRSFNSMERRRRRRRKRRKKKKKKKRNRRLKTR